MEWAFHNLTTNANGMRDVHHVFAACVRADRIENGVSPWRRRYRRQSRHGSERFRVLSPPQVQALREKVQIAQQRPFQSPFRWVRCLEGPLNGLRIRITLDVSANRVPFLVGVARAAASPLTTRPRSVAWRQAMQAGPKFRCWCAFDMAIG